MTEIDKLLQTYSLTEILEINELTEEEVLEYLVEIGFVNLPDVLPI